MNSKFFSVLLLDHMFCWMYWEEKWKNIQRNLDRYLTCLELEIMCTHKLENLIILFTKQYILQNKIKTSKLNANFIKKSLTKRTIDRKCLLVKNCNYYKQDTYWEAIFLYLELSSPSDLSSYCPLLSFRVFLISSLCLTITYNLIKLQY